MDPRPSGFLVWGGGGHGKVVADLIRAAGDNVIGFVDRDPGKRGRPVEPGGARVIYTEAEFVAHIEERGCYPDRTHAVALAIGDNRARQRCLAHLASLAAPRLIHPYTAVSPSAAIHRATVVFAGAVINADVEIGEAVIVNSGAVIEHDCRISAAVHVSPGAILAGGVLVDERAWIGAGATILPGLHVGSDVVVGAGAVVVRDVPDGLTVCGVPAIPTTSRGQDRSNQLQDISMLRSPRPSPRRTQ